MPSGLLDQFMSIFEGRFIRVAFLPVLLWVPAVAAPVVLQEGRLQALVRSWDTQSGSLKALEVIGFLAVTWFLATILESQLRNITQLFEGYPFEQRGWQLAQVAVVWHQERSMRLEEGERFYLYPDTGILPTRLGNILRAAEYQPADRYNAPIIFVWPRLYRVLPPDARADVERARNTLEFLLVLSLWCGTFAGATFILLLALSSPPLLTVSCFVTGMLLAYAAYLSALPAAIEYGEQLRTSFELYRWELLAKLGLKAPGTLGEERNLWRYAYHFALNEARDYPAPQWWRREWTYRPIAPTETTLNVSINTRWLSSVARKLLTAASRYREVVRSDR